MLDSSEAFKCYPFVLIKCERSPTRDKSRNIVFAHEAFTRPYQMLANELLILVSSGKFGFTQDFFQIQRQFGAVEHLVNDCTKLKVGLLTEQQWNELLNIPRDAFVKQQVRVIGQDMANKFLTTEGRMPTEQELARLTEDYIREHWGNVDP